MAKFEADTLSDLRDLKEVRIRTEKHPDSAVVIWVVVTDDEVFVRSFRGTKGRWYRDLATGGPATLEFAGRRLRVQAIPANDPAAIDAGQPRVSRQVSVELLCPGDGAARNVADDAAPRTALTGGTLEVLALQAVSTGSETALAPSTVRTYVILLRMD